MEEMTMKKIYMLIVALVAAVSCSMLEENTDSFVSPANFYKSVSQARAGVNGCYIPLKSIYNYNMALAVEGCTDLMYCPSGTQDAQLDISPANPRFGSTMWTQGYKGVRYCNDAIYAIENSEKLTEEQKAPLVAETKILRGLYYYLLTSFFGDVPFWTEPMTSFAVQRKIQQLPRMSAAETRDWIITDLLSCVDALPQGRAYDVAQGTPENAQRAGAAMGYVLIAKHAMWNERWQDAHDALVKVVDMYGALDDRYPLSDVPFSAKNTPESIFEIQHTYSPGGLAVTGNYACACMPYNKSTTDPKKAIYDGVKIELIDTNATPWNSFRPTPYFWQGLMPRTSKDKRRDNTIVWEYNGQVFEAFINRNADGSFKSYEYNRTPWLGPKFWCPKMYDTKDSNNYPVFRYADVLLMQAECLCMMDGKEQEAMDHLNYVKDRAGIIPYTVFRTKAKLLEEIQRERARELIGEFHRKFDLVRWGIWYQSVFENNNYLKNRIRKCHEYYPIPDSEVGLSGGKLDNKAYDANI